MQCYMSIYKNSEIPGSVLSDNNLLLSLEQFKDYFFLKNDQFLLVSLVIKFLGGIANSLLSSRTPFQLH